MSSFKSFAGQSKVPESRAPGLHFRRLQIRTRCDKLETILRSETQDRTELDLALERLREIEKERDDLREQLTSAVEEADKLRERCIQESEAARIHKENYNGLVAQRNELRTQLALMEEAQSIRHEELKETSQEHSKLQASTYLLHKELGHAKREHTALAKQHQELQSRAGLLQRQVEALQYPLEGGNEATGRARRASHRGSNCAMTALGLDFVSQPEQENTVEFLQRRASNFANDVLERFKNPSASVGSRSRATTDNIEVDNLQEVPVAKTDDGG